VKTSTGIIVGLGLAAVICCSGVGFLGYQTYNKAKSIDDEVTVFADKELPLILTNWDMAELQKHESPEMVAQAPQPILKSWFDLFSTRLGKLKSIKPSKMIGFYNFSGTSGAYSKADVEADAVFEKGPGKVYLVLFKRKGEWQIGGLKIDSPAMANAKV